MMEIVIIILTIGLIVEMAFIVAFYYENQKLEKKLEDEIKLNIRYERIFDSKWK